MLITVNGMTFDGYDERLWNDLRAIDAEVARREGRPPRTNGFMAIDLRTHPDLQEEADRAYAAAAARLRDRPPLLVKAGDWVRINGYRFRVASVDPEARIVDTERYDASGRFVSSAPCRGDGLTPDTSDAPDPDDLRPPDSLRDGYDRARYVLKAHKRALGDRGLDR